MIVRKFQWILLFSLHLLSTITAQNSRSYDTNDWIPITPTNQADDTKKAQGRVLTLETPNQNFFPENEYVRKRPQPQQYLRETAYQKGANVRQQPKTDQPYKFEPVLPLQSPQFVQQTQFIPPAQQPQYVQTLQQQVPVVQRPIQEPVLNQELVAPPPQNGQNYYNPGKGQLYETGLLSQEIAGAIKNAPNVNKIELTSTTTKPKEEKESVQLLYVPLENLKQNYPTIPQQVKAVVSKPGETGREEKKLQNYQNHKQLQLENIEDDFIRQALAAHKLQEQFQLGQPVLLQSTTTPKPKKRKPHQPPLAVYMEKRGSADVKDVLEVLKHAKTISVQDNIGPNSPQVFVGPSNLKTADGYVKFPLPYLSNVQGNRIERKVEQLPFFVAPLSYKTPEGYSKIPLPSPHVGSVVVSTKEELHEKHPEQIRQAQTAQNQIIQDFDVKQPFPQYRQEVKPDYFINQNPPQQSNSGLLSLGNDFLASLRGNAPQTYETTSPRDILSNYQVNHKGNVAEDYPDTPVKEYVPQNYQQPPPKQLETQNYQQTPNKDFITNLQLGLKDNSQFYQSTPTYENQPKGNIRGNYQIPEYQTNLKEAPPTQNSKEIIRDYDIPSVPVESKNSFIPSFQLEAKPQVNQFPSALGPTFVTPKNQPNVYTISEEPIRHTTTTEDAPIVQNQYKLVQNAEPQYTVPAYNTRNQDPFRQVINQYEIEQINSQLGDGKNENTEQIRTTTPNKNYEDYDVPTTVRTRSRSRQRGRTKTTTSTTPNSISDETYTVLEEFNALPKTTTTKYTTEVETIPANVYKLNTDRLEPVFIQNKAPVKQHVLNQEALDQQILQGNQPNRGNQYLLTRQNQEPQGPRGQIQDPNITPIVYNRGQIPQEQEVSQGSPYLPGLINNLQDQAVRPLLVPNLLVPTTEKLSTTSRPTTEVREIITTEAPRIETTTQRRSRGRVRANTSTSSRQSTSSPRRTSRRRPAHTRPTTERQSLRTTTEAAPSYEPTKRTGSQRQRFRTRGRPLPKETPATERAERVERVERVLQTTENSFKQPVLEGGFQASSRNPAPQSYYQFDHIIENQQVITVKPEETNEEKQPLKEYHMVYSLPAQTNPPLEQIPETTSTTSRPVVDVQITHAVSANNKEPVEREEPRFVSRINGNIQSGGVIHNTPHDATTRASVRIRGKSRSRGRFSSTTPRPVPTTTTTTTTTEKSKEESEEEFYGFIRSPTFNKPSLLVHTTQQPVQLYSSSYQDPPRTLIQLEEEEVNPHQNQDPESGSSAPVHFVGEIRPKYTTTEVPEPSTEVPKFRTRARIRVPNRKPTPQPAYNEVKSQKLDDQVTRRSSNVVRARGRGKSHFKLPDHMTTKPDDHDVEGGNYPSVYKSKELTTEKPAGFQITVDPYDEAAGSDQEPHYSLYSPMILKNANEEWVEASILPSPNDLLIEDKQMFVDSSEETTTVADDQPEDDVQTTVKPEETTIQNEETTIKNEETTIKNEETTKKKKKGVWKLIRHRPVDSFETAESQHYRSVFNTFDEIAKEKPSRTTTTTTTTTAVTPTEASLLDTLYNMLGLASKASTYEHPAVVKINKTKIAVQRNEEITTTPTPPTFPEEYTEETTTQQIHLDYDERQGSQEGTTTNFSSTSTTTTENMVKNYDVEPWNMKEIKTSTSTEVSHETEICFKGKCVKSKEKETNS